jgi:mannose-6-phosphate isomerase
MNNVPMKFRPIYKERIWGGDRLQSLFDKDLPAGTKIGESWELADLPADCSVVAEGPWAGKTLREILDEHGRDLGFTSEQCEHPFGLLIKFLDANDVLSVQVHPDENACRQFEGARLKTECWYVLQAQPDSVIYLGLKPGIGRDRLAQAIEAGNVEKLMEVYPAKKGDFHFLPAGTIHALGAGVMVAEIQTPSDTTYRLYDWNRVDAQGYSRQLHLEQALASVHYTDSPPTAADTLPTDGEISSPLQQSAEKLGKTHSLVDCPYFSVVHLSLEKTGRRVYEMSLPVVMMVLSGTGMVGNVENAEVAWFYHPGDTILIPNMEEAFFHIKQPGECLWVSLGPVKVK